MLWMPSRIDKELLFLIQAKLLFPMTVSYEISIQHLGNGERVRLALISCNGRRTICANGAFESFRLPLQVSVHRRHARQHKDDSRQKILSSHRSYSIAPKLGRDPLGGEPYGSRAGLGRFSIAQAAAGAGRMVPGHARDLY
jgi:hypothetical protein